MEETWPDCSLTEDFAGAADLKIAHGDLHAAAVALRFDERIEPFAGDFREFAAGAGRGNRRRRVGSIFRLGRGADRDRRGQTDRRGR